MSWIPKLSAMFGVMNMPPLLPQPQLIYGAYAGYNDLNVFNIIAQHKAAELGIEMAQMQHQANKLDVISQTTSAYYTLIAQKKELQIESRKFK